ncbi:hypothetical protein CEAn_00141 [Coxiella endosymbiont of Amblyomma nuttalli]|nr:hypothetical protein CEAn_00141 [Coxiella endosymbiont of Amblyomma nuttalli]
MIVMHGSIVEKPIAQKSKPTLLSDFSVQSQPRLT